MLKEKSIEVMSRGKACAIFRDLLSDQYTLNEKGLAIYTVLSLETMNSITKVELANALRWLWNEHFELCYASENTE